MGFTVISKNKEQTFENKTVIYIGSMPKCDFCIDVDFKFVIGVKYDHTSNKCIIINKYKYPQLTFKGEPLPEKLIVDKVCKIIIKDSNEFITIKLDSAQTPVNKEQNIQTNYQNNIEISKDEIEEQRIKIVKEISPTVSALKRKISVNSKTGILLHITLFVASFICAFGVSNYLTGLPLTNDGTTVQIPTNTKLVLLYSLIIYSVGLMLKQGFFLYLRRKDGDKNSTPVVVEKLMIVLSLVFFIAIYLINLLYYIASKDMALFAIFISAFYAGTALVLSLGCGYFKNGSYKARKELDKYEYRPDFEMVIKSYQNWIEKYAASLSQEKNKKVKDKMLNLQIWQTVEILLGLITAPFLAYGVSNTLAMCFPEAAGWLRIGGIRFSLIFLVLATFLIIFAFFSFVSGFTTKKKISASEIIKQDGFSNYLTHGTEIYGLEGTKKLDEEMRRFFIIGIAIIIIEFTMNVSYFIQEMGSGFSAMFVSTVAALVPTALLLAETVMLSHTKFETVASDELLAKTDGE